MELRAREKCPVCGGDGWDTEMWTRCGNCKGGEVRYWLPIEDAVRILDKIRAQLPGSAVGLEELCGMVKDLNRAVEDLGKAADIARQDIADMQSRIRDLDVAAHIKRRHGPAPAPWVGRGSALPGQLDIPILRPTDTRPLHEARAAMLRIVRQLDAEAPSGQRVENGNCMPAGDFDMDADDDLPLNEIVPEPARGINNKKEGNQ